MDDRNERVGLYNQQRRECKTTDTNSELEANAPESEHSRLYH